MKRGPVHSRRRLIRFGAAAGGIVLAGGTLSGAASARKKEGEEETVSANEDLMREHGVLRRVLIVYTQAAERLRERPADLDPAALADAAELFREFGQQYHERTLEEKFVFPALRKAGGDAAGLVDELVAQHRRGEEITDHVLSVLRRGKVGADRAAPLAEALDSMVRMYRAHAAWEDTVLFPAWSDAMSPQERQTYAERFEALETERFGAGAFEQAVERVARAEKALGIADLAAYTAPPPPARE